MFCLFGRTRVEHIHSRTREETYLTKNGRHEDCNDIYLVDEKEIVLGL